MLTKHEINALNLSPTKKDFVQIWNELLDVAGKLSERWDPTSTNESDPGIVLLKALTGIADKLNYNIDKNTLEAFMPTAAQEDSMRKLCEMLGYNIKYYQSAKTEVTIKYHNSDPTEEETAAITEGLLIPKFTVITNGDKDINYFTVNATPVYIAAETPSQTIECMEGQIVKCESINDNNIITANQIDENNRFYLPETQIAENGIFVYNVFYNNESSQGNLGLDDGTPWTMVDNLNVYRRGERVFKFGYDSYESRPYIEFPDDYSDLFNDGLFIYYARTNGMHGNISSHTLTQLEAPNLTNWDKVPVESFTVDNIFAATSGAHIETIKQAYNNFKKTIGTFETLVTCRDYMNKIYAMTNSVGKPYISNILVTDMRNDLNRALTICSCDDAGIFYKERPIVERKEVEHTTKTGISVENTVTKPVFASENSWENAAWRLGSATGPKLLNGSWIVGTLDDSNLSFDYTKEGEVFCTDTYDCWLVNQKVAGAESYTTFLTNLACRIVKEDQVTKVEKEWTSTPLINHFDLVFYPYKSYNQIKSEVKDVRSVYDNSFNYTNIGFNEIKARLEAEQLKTISHNIITPRHSSVDYIGDIVSINNYLRLNATIATNAKITMDEGTLLKHKIKTALSNAFNMRELDFGEEIPFESIVEVIENADSRIKVASLNEPALYTTYSVFDHIDDSGHPVIVEYAVASDYLSLEDADKSDRFIGTTATGDLKNTFDTNEARKIYNKLLLRNILAGRVALFKYNNTFDTNFSEAPYQETIVYPKDPNHASILSLARPSSFPAGLENPSADNPYTVYTENGVTYTARQYDDNSLIKYEFAESKTPELFNGNVIDQDANGNDITKITPFCHIAINDGCIPGEGREKLVLSDGETIKFRAPNFTTVKTYPAYVNYHLSLKEELDNNGEAVAAEAENLFSVLDSDRESWSSSNTGVKWQKVIDYFRSVDVNNKLTKTPTEYVQTFTLSQEVSKFTQAASSGEDACPVNESGEHVIDPTTNTCRYCGTPMFSQVQKGAIVVDIKNNEAEEKDVEGLFAKSGCVKLTNKCIKLDTTTGKYLFRAKLLWKPADGETAPPGEGPDLDIDIGLRSPFISDISTLSNIKELVNTAIEERRNMVKDDGITPVLPSECSWCITFDFECVPFEPASLNEWNKFIKLCAQSEGGNYGSVLSYKPIEELGTVFWRAFGEGYQIGKYIQANSQKLLKFDKNYFGLLPQTAYMTGIYLAKSLGQDASPHIIHNLEEYRLQSGEYLFIEYTPSSTTEDGTTQDLPPVTEILGEGTIIRPGGFEVGLLDSDVLSSQGTSAHKTVSFLMPDGSAQEISMHRFGANEQVEIRDLAKVELSKDTFKSSPVVYVYKNFNDCPELETLEGADSGSIRTYTLKDGEFVFYTDQNRSELAYFGSGTEVQLHGDVVLPKCESVDLVEVFDSSIEEIPWKYLPFERSNQKIIFQEFQYITIGSKDTVENITVLGAEQPYLDDKWLFCSDVSYKLAGEENPKPLPKVSIPGRAGDGWEVCSVLDISVSPSDAQILRYVPDVVETGLKLSGNSQGGGDADEVKVSPKNDNQAENSLAFKSNLACQALSNNSVYLSDIYNQNKLTGFEFKFFADEPIALVKTKPGKVVPNTGEAYTSWRGEPIATKDYLDIWNQVGLDKIKVEAEDGAFDNALRLSVCTIPGTYGIVCIYVNYTSTDAITNARTWIEALPGTPADAIKIFNGTNGWENESGAISSSLISEGDRLYLSEGINCVRINKTGQLFIKTSEGSQGVLMFDDLKLVDCESISYKNTANEDKTIPTYGLNLKQLHYLPVRTEGTLLDNEVRARMEKALCDDLFKETDKMLLELNKTIKTNTDHFTTDYTNIEKISDDLEHIDALSADAYRTLITAHGNLTESIAKESELLDNLTAKTVENELLNLISQYASADISEAQLLEELAKLKAQIASTLKNRTAEQSLESFESTITNSKLSSEIASTFNEAKEITVQKLDKDLLSQVTELVSELERVTATSEKTRISEALNKLQTVSKNSNIVDVQILLNKIANSADINDITSLITDMTISHSNKEYATLAAQATSLRGIITSRNVLFYVEELNNAIANGNSQASALAGELATIITEENTIVTNIDTLITRCGATSVNATNIKTSFDAIVSGVNALYTDKLSKLVNGASGTTSLKTEVDAVFSANGVNTNTVTAINNVVDQLNTNANTDAAAIAGKIKGLLDAYSTDISTFKDLTATTATWATVKASKYFEALSSTLSILWLQTLQKAWLTKFNIVELSTRTLIKGGQTTAAAVKTAANDTKTAITNYSTAFAPYDQDILGIDGLNSIVEAACVKTRTAIQNANTISTISTLSTAVGFDGLISAAKDDFDEDNNKNIILIGLLQDFEACTDVYKKANLISRIKAELTKLKASDERLLELIEKELFKNIYEILSKYKDVDEEARAKVFEFYFTAGIRSRILAKLTKPALTTAGYGQAFNVIKTGIPLLVKDDLTATETSSLNSLTTSELLSEEDKSKIVEVMELRRFKLLINSINQGLVSDDTTDKRVFIDSTLKSIGDDTEAKAELKELLTTLVSDLNEVALKSIDTDESLEVITVEEQLLKDLIDMDMYKEFYYTAPIETHLAIEFIGNKDSEKTMMNPATNYDINNVNNSFVISKIDIDYLDEGISLARASRLN